LDLQKDVDAYICAIVWHAETVSRYVIQQVQAARSAPCKGTKIWLGLHRLTLVLNRPTVAASAVVKQLPIGNAGDMESEHGALSEHRLGF
jgi:hypothetical protein